MIEIEAAKILKEDSCWECSLGTLHGATQCGNTQCNVARATNLAVTALEQLALYKKGGLCLVPADIYEKQCKELDELKGSRWIPCSERLPEVQATYDIFKRPSGYISDSVLVTVKSKEVGGTRYYVDTDIMTGSTLENAHWLMSCGYGGSAVYSQEIIAWRPKPEEYKPEQEEV